MPIFIFLIILTLSISSGYAQDWKLKKSKGDVQVFIEDSEEPIRAVKAEFVSSSALYSIVNVLRDIESAPQWMDSVKDVRLLARENVDIDLVATTLDLPWPFQDRLMVTRSQICHNDVTLVIKIWDVPNIDVEVSDTDGKDVVRMSEIRGEWRVDTLDDDHIKLSYQGVGYPGGNIPNWLARGKLVSSTFKTFQQLQQQIVATKYQDKPLGYDKMANLDACSTPQNVK